MNRRPSNDHDGPSPTLSWRRPPGRRALVWAIALAISLTAALVGGGIILWTVHFDLRSSTTMGVGVALVVFGFAASALWLGVWLVSGNHHRPMDGP